MFFLFTIIDVISSFYFQISWITPQPGWKQQHQRRGPSSELRLILPFLVDRISPVPPLS